MASRTVAAVKRMEYVIAFVLGGVVSVLLLILYASFVMAAEDDRRSGRK